MFQNIIFFAILGQPLVLWVGILTFILFISTAVAGYLMHNSLANITVRQHMALAFTALSVGLIHALMAFFGFVLH